MALHDFTTQFIQQLQQTTALEAVAVVFSMVSVVLANMNNVWLYPTGIVGTVIYVWIMAKVGLYAESLLNLYYLIMSIYGWVLWQKGKENDNPAAISHNNTKDWTITAAICIAGWAILYGILSNYTDSTVPALDAVVSATAWAGMWLLAKHKIENWVLLNISNAIAIPLYIYKGIPFTAFLTLFLFIVAIFGYFRWKKQYRLLHIAS
jgi:nicotinamide mononucleotide transporter